MIKKYINNKKRSAKPYIYINGLHRLSMENGFENIDDDALNIPRYTGGCILGRAHYTERQETYPIKNITHLYKVIQAETKSVNGGKLLWAITNYELGNFQVTYWFIGLDVVNILSDHFKIILPETYLLSKEFIEDGVYQVGTQRTLFLKKDSTYLYSALRDSLVADIERFTQMTGVEDGAPYKSLSDNEYSVALINQFNNWANWLIPGCLIYKKAEMSFDLSNWKLPIFSSVALIVLYSVSVSYYLDIKLEKVGKELAYKRTEMIHFLNEEEELDGLKSKVSGYQNIDQNSPGLSVLLGIISSVKTDIPNMKVRNFDLNDNKASVRITSDSATEVFDVFSNRGDILRIDFTSPIAKNRDKKEQFELSFTFVKGD